MKWSFAVLIFTITLTFGCGNALPKNDCKYGTPTAIFQAQDPGIQSHQFEVQGSEATEMITFADGLELQLRQSGCDAIRQEFQFALPGQWQQVAPRFWIERSIQLLRRLGSMGPAYSGFSSWAQTIENQQDQIKLAESVELATGFYVTIDRIISAENATLVLILSDQP